MEILDAWYGFGGTSINLIKKYPNVKFTGIKITPEQIILGKNIVISNLDAKNNSLKTFKFKIDILLKRGFYEWVYFNT
jgi:hypothetical protein